MRFLILAFLLCACGPTFHLKQAERHLRKAEIKGAQVRVDTVYKTISVIVPEVHVDTLIKEVNFRDTIEFWQDRFHVRVKVDTITKSVYIEGKCESDTIRVDVPISVVKEIKTGISFWWILLLIGICLILLFFRKR